MNNPHNFSNLLVTHDGQLVFLTETDYIVLGVKEYQDELYFKLAR